MQGGIIAWKTGRDVSQLHGHWISRYFSLTGVEWDVFDPPHWTEVGEMSISLAAYHCYILPGICTGFCFLGLGLAAGELLLLPSLTPPLPFLLFLFLLFPFLPLSGLVKYS